MKIMISNGWFIKLLLGLSFLMLLTKNCFPTWSFPIYIYIYIWSILDESDSYVRMWEDIFYVFIWSQKINSIIGLHQLLLLIKVLNFHDHPMCWGVLSMWVKLCLDKSNWWLTRFVHILTIIDVVCLYIGWSWYFKTLIDT